MNLLIYVWGQSQAVTYSAISGNHVKFTNSQNVENNCWLASGESTPAGWNTNKWGADLDESVLPANIISF